MRGVVIIISEIFILYFRKNSPKVTKHLQEYAQGIGILHKTVRTAINLTSVTIFFGLSTILITGLISFRNKLLFPERFENINYIFENVKTKFGSEQKSKILYFNDKFIFVELIQSQDKIFKDAPPSKLLIYKSEDVLFK
ncbi:hypothetical protein [Frigoriflavimonas asaccharolytica]|uniref:Uncharacterized protein n=1 Tax=Frigoriflavimonas asaccharolytica TaxID=2735899 RepID=A0A8J8GA76_9FLAO|nr:hypothetical protein [Frigoriflavimonas asaccharolytica]NRS92429.1 hypothetical protein [Frigoriflavimonas asaccharolytica]